MTKADLLRKTIAQVRTMQLDTRFQTIGIVTSIRSRTDKLDHTYWIVSIADKSDTIEARVWSGALWYDLTKGAKRDILRPAQDALVSNLTGHVVGVVGLTSEFKGKRQYQFHQVWILDDTKPAYARGKFIRAANVPLEIMQEQFRALVDGCGGESGDFLRFVFDPAKELWPTFCTLPAAVAHHHAYVHGLLEHTLGVARSAKAIAESYKGTDSEPDVDIVVAGACLHDIGKLDTYRLSPGPQITLDGTVIDHIATGYVRFCKLADEFGLSSLLRTLLGHIILSHHGLKEYGSPVMPATPEAMIVSFADNLDFQLNSWVKCVANLSGGTDPTQAISDVDYALQRRMWKWRPTQPR